MGSIIFWLLAAVSSLCSWADSNQAPQLDCSKLIVDQVDFSSCWVKPDTKVQELSLNGIKFHRFTDCWAQFSGDGEVRKLFYVDPVGVFQCAPAGINQYCLSPEEHISVSSPPCTGTTMSADCSLRILPSVPALPSGEVLYDPRYQCSCREKGCGHVISTFERERPKVEEIRAAVTRIVPGCDDIVIKDVTPVQTSDKKSHETAIALSSKKCPLLKPIGVNRDSCPKGFREARSLFIGKTCKRENVFAVVCLSSLDLASEKKDDPCYRRPEEKPAEQGAGSGK